MMLVNRLHTFERDRSDICACADQLREQFLLFQRNSNNGKMKKMKMEKMKKNDEL